MDDFDRVFLNGELIGKTKDGRSFGNSDSYDEYRIYDLEDGLLDRFGLNELIVEVEDIGGNAGIYKGPIGIVPLKDYRKYIRDYEWNN